MSSCALYRMNRQDVLQCFAEVYPEQQNWPGVPCVSGLRRLLGYRATLALDPAFRYTCAGFVVLDLELVSSPPGKAPWGFLYGPE